MRQWLWMATLLGVVGVASAQPRPVLVEISSSTAPGALTARYSLPTPAVEFKLDASNAPQRDGTWLPQGSGWNFDGIAIRRADGAPFSRFELQIQPDRQFIDRHFVSVDRIGDSGWAIFLEAFRAADFATRLRIAPCRDCVVRDGATTWKGAKAFSANLAGENRVVFFGPSRYIARGPVTMITGAEIPSWLVEHVRADAGVAVTKLTARFGAVGHEPTVIITSTGKWSGSSFKGSSLADAVIHLSLRGFVLDKPDENLSRTMTNTIIHEIVHVWNRGSSAGQQPWLHEGSAEYLAARLWRTPEDLRATATRRLNACLDRPDRRPMNGSAGQVAGGAPYDCGFVIQLFAEAASRTAAGQDIFELWKAVFAQAVEGEYSPEQFLALASARGPGFADLATPMLGNPDVIDRAQLLSGMRRIGIEAVDRQPEAQAFRAAGIMAVLQGVCTGSRGFTPAADRLILDTGGRCGSALAGDPAIVSVNGVDLMRTPVQAYEAIRDACAAGSAVTFARPDRSRLDPVPCTARVQPPRMIMQLTALPDLP